MTSSTAAFLAALALTASLAACAPKPPGGVDSATLDAEIARTIGSASTCMLIADKSGATVYRYGSNTICGRELPACAQPGNVTNADVLKAAIAGDARNVSCDSVPDATRTVAWASGPVPATAGKPAGFVFAVAMEGVEALPGREIKQRLESVWPKAGF
jgi:hypothetical protein